MRPKKLHFRNAIESVKPYLLLIFRWVSQNMLLFNAPYWTVYHHQGFSNEQQNVFLVTQKIYGDVTKCVALSLRITKKLPTTISILCSQLSLCKLLIPRKWDLQNSFERTIFRILNKASARFKFICRESAQHKYLHSCII